MLIPGNGCHHLRFIQGVRWAARRLVVVRAPEAAFETHPRFHRDRGSLDNADTVKAQLSCLGGQHLVRRDGFQGRDTYRIRQQDGGIGAQMPEPDMLEPGALEPMVPWPTPILVLKKPHAANTS